MEHLSSSRQSAPTISSISRSTTARPTRDNKVKPRSEAPSSGVASSRTAPSSRVPEGTRVKPAIKSSPTCMVQFNPDTNHPELNAARMVQDMVQSKQADPSIKLFIFSPS